MFQGEVRPRIVTAQPSVPVEIHPGRWLNLYNLLDGRGHDADCGILAELHKDTPDGALLRRRIIVDGGDDYEPFNDSEKYFRCIGQPSVFGSWKTGIFVVCFYQYAHQFRDGVLQNSGSANWTGRPFAHIDSLRLHYLQFKYDIKSEDLIIVKPDTELRQVGYEKGEAFCSMGPDRLMNRPLQPPVQLDADGYEFVELAGLSHKTDNMLGSHATIAPIRWKFNEKEGCYQWVETGKPWKVAEHCGEAASILLDDGSFLTSIRQFGKGTIILTRTEDLFKGPEKMTFNQETTAPRSIYKCRDGQIRLFTNFPPIPNLRHERNPLCEAIVDGELKLRDIRPIADASALHLPWESPFLDLPKYVETHDKRSLLLIRAIDRSQTVGNMALPKLEASAYERQGVHYLEASWE